MKPRPKNVGKNAWVSVKDWLPECSLDPNALGVPVLIWPRPKDPNMARHDGLVYYGCRATGDKPTFYIYGAIQDDVTHWRYLPAGPK